MNINEGIRHLKILHLCVVNNCVFLMMLVSLTTVTHSADFFSSPATEDHDPQPTPKPGKWCWPLGLLHVCVVHIFVTTSHS